jgi:cobaltochelatase CobS
LGVVLARLPELDTEAGHGMIRAMISVADMTRKGFQAGDISTLMSPRTVITWAENVQIFGNVEVAFRLSYLNKCDDVARATVAEYYQRAFDKEIVESSLHAAG